MARPLVASSQVRGNPTCIIYQVVFSVPLANLQSPLLGFAGFLQFFTATFRGDREEIELTVNSLYPGT